MGLSSPCVLPATPECSPSTCAPFPHGEISTHREASLVHHFQCNTSFTKQHPGAPPQGPTTAGPRDARPGQAVSCPQGHRSLKQTGEDPGPHFSIPLTRSIHDFSLVELGTRSPLRPRGCLQPSSGPLV